MRAENNASRNVCFPFAPNVLVYLDHVHMELNIAMLMICAKYIVCANLALLEWC